MRYAQQRSIALKAANPQKRIRSGAAKQQDSKPYLPRAKCIDLAISGFDDT